MSKTSPLDHRDEAKEPNAIWDVIAWWEKRRLAYGLLLGAAQVYACVTGWNYLSFYYTYTEALVQSTLYHLVAQALYSAGWAAEVGLRYYVRRINFGRGPRVLLWLLGLLFSLGLTFLLYGTLARL
ncbi:MAG: hypothetical protein AAFW73_07170 [Bacteroidota bacterium]